MEVVHCPPGSPPGAGVVRCSGYRAYFAEPRVRHSAPSGGVKVILRFGDPVRSATGTSGPVPATASAFVVGVKDTPGSTVHAGEVHSLQVEMTPLGAYRVLGVPMRALGGAAADLADVLGPAADLLVERLALTDDWNARFRLLGRVLAERAAAADAPDPAVAWAWRRLHRSGGTVAVAELAAELGMSRRHLSRRFHHQLGLPPKSMARVLRFNRAVRLRAMEPERSWTRIAADCGYHDHAHLDADFRALAACTPTEFATRTDVLARPS
ncbi:helix-turn-helix domain-containing protein [Spirillospora sp. NPDC029432]|uniref:AraC family transcriptional regulator n=1 Tax=Spirillospora sp. NPDC029432 TaxID=3154599 RepID=UPI003452B6E0